MIKIAIKTAFLKDVYTILFLYMSHSMYIIESRTCPVGWFDCLTNYRCIPSWQVCDGTDDCRDGSDEIPDKCVACHPVGDFACNSGNQCIRARLVFT